MLSSEREIPLTTPPVRRRASFPLAPASALEQKADLEMSKRNELRVFKLLAATKSGHKAERDELLHTRGLYATVSKERDSLLQTCSELSKKLEDAHGAHLSERHQTNGQLDKAAGHAAALEKHIEKITSEKEALRAVNQMLLEKVPAAQRRKG